MDHVFKIVVIISCVLASFTSGYSSETDFIVEPIGLMAEETASPADNRPELEDAAAYGDCCDGCPSWPGRVGYVHMWREAPGDAPLLADADAAGGPPGVGTPVMFASQFDFGGESGVDASLAWDNGFGQGFQVRYLGVEEFGAEQTFNAGFNVLEATNPPTDEAFSLFLNQPILLGFQSELQSLELLRRQCCGSLNWTYGFRYVDLDETLSLISTNISDVFNAENALYGFQLGVDGLLWDNGCGLRVESLANAGVYYNNMDASTQSTAGPVSGQASDGDAVFVGELRLSALYDISCCLTLRAGYQLLFLDGVILSADQVSNTGDLNTGVAPGGGFLLPPVNIDKNSLLFHGLHIGLELCY